MTLRETQQRFAAALVVPLSGGERIAGKIPRGRSMEKEAAEILKPNDRLTSLERLEIYSRSYWFRLLDSMRDDYPGLRAILGLKRFVAAERVASAICGFCILFPVRIG